MASSTPKLYKTLPGPIRPKEERKRSADPHTHRSDKSQHLSSDSAVLHFSGLTIIEVSKITMATNRYRYNPSLYEMAQNKR